MESLFPAYKGDGPFVFVSYSHEDRDLVFPEISWLRDQGFNIWYDEGIQPGRKWRAELSESIKRSSLFLFFVSPNSVTSNHCLGEVDLAIDHDKSIITVHLAETELPSGLDLTLARIQAILRDELSETVYREKLIAGIGDHLQRGVARAVTSAPRVIRPSGSATILAGVIVVVGLVYSVFLLQSEYPNIAPAPVTKFTIEFPY